MNNDKDLENAKRDVDNRLITLGTLVEARQFSGLSQHDMARKMQTDVPFIRAFESGYSDPHLSTYQRYARALGASVSIEVEGLSGGRRRFRA